MPVTRITFTSEQQRLRDNLFRVQRDYEAASLPATTGKVVNNLSDNPTITSRILAFRSKVQSADQFQRNMTLGRLRINTADNQLGNAYEALLKIRNIALQASDPTTAATQLSQLSTQIGDLKTEILNYANGKLDGQYIFAGTATSTQPFSGTPTAFAGNTNALTVQVSTTTTVQLNFDGSIIFTGSGGGQDIFAAIDSLQTAVSTQSAAGIATGLSAIDTGMSQVLKARGDVGIRIQQLDSYESLLSDGRTQDLTSLSDLEDASVDDAFSKLVTRETALRLVFASSSRVLSAISGIQLQV